METHLETDLDLSTITTAARNQWSCSTSWVKWSELQPGVATKFLFHKKEEIISSVMDSKIPVQFKKKLHITTQIVSSLRFVIS